MDRLNINFETLGEGAVPPRRPASPTSPAFTLLTNDVAAAVFTRARQLVLRGWTPTGPYEVPSLDAAGEPAWRRTGTVSLALRLYDQGKLLRCSVTGAVTLAWFLEQGTGVLLDEQLGELLSYLLSPAPDQLAQSRLEHGITAAAALGLGACDPLVHNAIIRAERWNHRVGKRTVVTALRDAEARLRGLKPEAVNEGEDGA